MRTRFAVALAFVASSPATAVAQTRPSIDARTWAPSSDPEASLATEPASVPDAWQWNVAAWAHYAQQPIALRDPATGNPALRPIAHSLGSDVVAGLGLGRRASVGVDVPVVSWQDGTSPLPPSVASSSAVPTSAIGDVALFGKATLVSNGEQQLRAGWGLAAVGALSLPTGDRASFVGDGSVTASLRLLGEYAIGVGALRASAGYKLRTDRHTWPDPSAGGVRFGSEIPWSMGAVLRPKVIADGLDPGDRQLWEVALHGSVPAGPIAPFGLGDPGASSLSPAMIAADDRIALGSWRDAYVLFGGDFGLDRAVGVPIFRAVASIGWAPRAHDRDHDGVVDDVDECPDLAEDADGIQDDDGCPEDDADGDGILDARDACPLVPGVWWNDPKTNGCPAPDTDGDDVPDPVDACPAVKGVRTDDPKKNGCPAQTADRDKDGVPDDADKCPDQAEDKDGNEDFDGCPDPDDDGDGIADVVDACPRDKGEPSTDPTRNGCPNPDRDGDTYDDDVDKCPDRPEVYNGVNDGDGCPDEGGAPLVTVEARGEHAVIRTAKPLEEAERSATALRAIALELNGRPEWTLAVGVRPRALGHEPDASLARAMEIAKRIAAYTHRESSVEAVGWDAVKRQPGAASGIGLLVVVVPQPQPPKR